MQQVLYSIYKIILALWVGGMSMFSFIVTPVLFKTHSRDMAGSIVGHIFPLYFLYNLILSGTALIVFLLLRLNSIRHIYYGALFLLTSAFIINLIHVTVIHPKVRRLKTEIHSLAAPSEYLPVKREFAKFHRMSVILNLIVLLEGILLIIITHPLRA